jgi:DNA polymerase elongation subunit (family B)
MSYKKCYSQKIQGNKHLVHLWDDDGYQKIEWNNPAYVECNESQATHFGINGEPLKKVYNWKYGNDNLHFHDMPPYQKFLIEKYGTNDEPSSSHKELFFDIEIEMGGALTPEYIKSAPKKITSIAWYYLQEDEWYIVILDDKNKIKHTKSRNKEIIPVKSEEELIFTFLERFRSIDPDILIGYNSDFFDIPYLYYRICNVLGEEVANYLSPINKVREKLNYKTGEIYDKDQPIEIKGVESLDYLRLHKKYSFSDEPSYKLDSLGKKYVNISKVEYDGTLDKLFEEDIHKFIQYNFVDVEILVKLDEKFDYIAITKNLSHKGKHNYGEVYQNTRTQDGAISAYLLSQNIIPPAKKYFEKRDYAGGYLFCPKAGIMKYVFDEDLTSLYPSIIMTLNIGRETMVGRIIDKNKRNNRLGLNNLKSLPPSTQLLIENPQGKQTYIKSSSLVEFIEKNNLSISANGVFFRNDKKSVLSTILEKWFWERVEYKNLMKKYFKQDDTENGAKFHQKQYTQKILLNSLYGALALPSFRYGGLLLAEATTLSGQRIIQESGLCVNKHMNKIIKEKTSSDP